MRACTGELTVSGEDGAFSMAILAGQTCWVFAFREDEEGFAKGPMVEVLGGESQRVDLDLPGVSASRDEQRAQLRKLADFVQNQLEQEHARPSPVATALDGHPDNPTLLAWSEEELAWLNLRYDDAEYLLSGEADDEDWREAWLFGIGM